MNKGSIRRATIANVGWLGAERVLRSATSFFVVVWIARYLGTEQFGLLNYAQSLAYAVYPIATFGLTGILVKDLVQDPENRDIWQSAAFSIRLLSGIAAFILSLLLAIFLADTALVLMVGIISLAFLFTPADGLDAEFQARMNNQPVVILKLLVFAGSTFFKVLAITLGSSVYWFAGIMTLEVVLIAFGLIVLVSRWYGVWIFLLDKEALKTMMAQALPLTFIGLLNGIYVRIDQILLGALSGYNALGEYAVAWKLVEAGIYVPTIMLASFAPLLASYYQKSAECYRHHYSKNFRFVFWLVLSGCLIVFLSASWVIGLFFGHRYLQADSILRILVWSVSLTVFNLFSIQWAINHRKSRIVWEMTLVGLLVCVALCFLLVPTYGGQGAAVAVVSSQLIGFLGYGWCRRDGRDILRTQFKALCFR